MTSPKIGIKNNKLQFALLVLMAISAGAMLGTLRTVIPSVSESEFGVAKDSFFMLTSFIVAFGFIKAIMNKSIHLKSCQNKIPMESKLPDL